MNEQKRGGEVQKNMNGHGANFCLFPVYDSNEGNI